MEGIFIVPAYKKGDKTECSNCRGISLLSTMYKNLSIIMLSGLTPYAEEITRYHQRRFRRNRITTDHTFCIRQIPEKRECAEAVPGLIMDPKKASGSVRREVLY